ncbi:MAG: hybrid sensor histidine kinase/response regulator [Beijerinckiaceae bacterium]
MVAGWAVVLTALLYLCLLFAVAHFGDRDGSRFMRGRRRSQIYALALAVYCTSWTFYGSVGFASRQGLDFLAVYLGPILVYAFGAGFLRRIVTLAKAQNTTSIADFVGARYGKSEGVAAIVCLVAVIGTVPYIALQLKAISVSLTTLIGAVDAEALRAAGSLYGDLALVVTFVLAFFTILFGTRHIDATEHQDGLVIAIAMESLVKLVAFLIVGAFVVFVMFDGLGDLLTRTSERVDLADLFAKTSSAGSFVSICLVSAAAALFLPRQFHTAVVENRDIDDVAVASRLFPLYLIVINIFVLPLTIAGLWLFSTGATDRDMTVLMLPLAGGQSVIALIAFIGGFSAATAMVIVECVAIAIMVSNHVVVPLLLRQRNWRRQLTAAPGDYRSQAHAGDMGALVLGARRITIVLILLLGYIYYRVAGEAELASIGLISFAAIAQIAPVFIGGLMWRRATAAGAKAGLIIGLMTWVYTLLLPSFAHSHPDLQSLIANGPFGIAALRPSAILGTGTSALTQGIVLSLLANVLAFVLVSRATTVSTLEHIQATTFIGADDAPRSHTLKIWRSSIAVGELKATIARYLGQQRTDEAFASFERERGVPLDEQAEASAHVLQFGEHLLASAIGAASSRLVLSLLLRRRNVSTKAALKLLDDASAAIQYNRDLLQNALDHAKQAITVFDRDLRLMCWNREFGQLFELPPELVRVGAGLDEIIAYNAAHGRYGGSSATAALDKRIEQFVKAGEATRLRIFPSGKVLEIRTSGLPDGGFITTYTDITDTVKAEEALAAANESLERRVQERTEELMRVNGELARAKSLADEANVSKTRFLAAASHDILQPLNAARLFTSSMIERQRALGDGALASNIDASLEAVEDILGALLEISRLDAGALKAEPSSFRLDDITRQLEREFQPIALAKNLRLRFVHPAITVHSDRRLTRRLLQNLVSNAVKYTPAGSVLVGGRRQGNTIRIEVIDTGLGIPADKLKDIFQEFQRLDEGARTARGLGLGLSIVERIARVLGTHVQVRSQPKKGSLFSFTLTRAADIPAAADEKKEARPLLAPLGGLTILAIDNEPTILEGMRTLLEGWGCRVVTATSIAGALERLEHGVIPDGIIADYHLNNETGLEAIDALRGLLGDSIPAVLITADRSPEVRDEVARRDIPLINKPVRPAGLRALLAQWRIAKVAAE